MKCNAGRALVQIAHKVPQIGLTEDLRNAPFINDDPTSGGIRDPKLKLGRQL